MKDVDMFTFHKDKMYFKERTEQWLDPTGGWFCSANEDSVTQHCPVEIGMKRLLTSYERRGCEATGVMLV